MKNKDIICIAVSDWSKPWGSKQHLMTQLARSNRVLYVGHQMSVLDFVKYPKYFFDRLGAVNKLRRVDANIHIYTPIPMLAFGNYFTFINRINQALLAFFLRRIVKQLKFKNPVLWTYSPTSADLVDVLNEGIVIYHCAADFSNEKRNRLRQDAVSRLEARLVKNADIVLTLTKELCSRLKDLNRNTFYFPSAVDLDYFGMVRDSGGREPADISVIKKPRLGVVGYFDGKIVDTALLDYIAKANLGWSLVMIGPLFKHARSLTRLRDNNNVYFLGEKQPAIIPLYLKYLDVCLVPYVRNKFTNNISSIKVYEYLAMGKPVIGTFFSDDLNDFKDIVGVAADKEEFLRLIHKFLNQKDDKAELEARMAFISENSWQRRLEFLDEKMREARLM